MGWIKILAIALVLWYVLPYVYRAGLPGADVSKLVCKDVVGGQTCYFINPDGSIRRSITTP